MTRLHQVVTTGLLSFALSCGGGGDDDDVPAIDGAPGGVDAVASVDGTGGGGVVPDPGAVEGGEWTDVEPNDTPGQATPVGVLNGPIWAGFVEPFTQIDDDDDVDFFVFKTKDEASLANVNVQLCWGGAVNLLDLYLYEVVDQHQGAEVDSAAGTDTSCETLIAFGEGDTTLVADTIYLLEVRPAPGLALGGTAAMYGA